MNIFRILDINYLQSSKTLETILVKNDTKERVIYVYNYEGWHYRVFISLEEIINFFEDEFEPHISFESEAKLDDFFLNLDLNEECYFLK
jgi:hypothetical protein